MIIQVLIKNVSRTFCPDLKSLGKLFQVVENTYHCPVEVVFETALSFRALSDGKVIPVSPVNVLVHKDASDGKQTYIPRAFSSQANLINNRIQDLLSVSKPSELNLPASVKIRSGGKVPA